MYYSFYTVTNFSSSIKCFEENWLTNNASNYEDYVKDIIKIQFDGSVLALRKVAYTFVSPSIVVIGILGNILNLIVLSRPILKSSMKTYLTALAVTDLSIMFAEIPSIIRLNGLHGQSYVAAFYYAHVEVFLVSALVSSSVYIVLCLTIDRLYSVCFPQQFHNVHTNSNAKASLLGSYGIGMVISLPLTLLKNICLIQDEVTHVSTWDFHENVPVTRTIYWSMYLLLSELVIRLGPIIVLTTLNLIIIKKVREHAATKKNLCTNSVTNESIQEQGMLNTQNKKSSESKIIILLHAIVILFVITMTPSALLSLLYSEKQESHFGFQAFRAVANILELLNFALNFYVYCLCSKEFRAAFVKVFLKR